MATGAATLAEIYDLAVLDLDGVVYRGEEAVPGATDALTRARESGMQLAFVTNNASRTPAGVAEHLAGLGLSAAAEDVVTSAQAAARLLAGQLEHGAVVFVIGGDGLTEALREHGLVPVTDPAAGAVAVAQGFGPQVPWRRVIDGAILVREGLTWVASNLDMTVPTERGPGPGNGTLVDLVARFSGRTPQVAGKPEPPLFRETIARVGGERPLVVGDRVDTDIDGARAMGWDSVLVMSGVTDLAELAALPAQRRARFLGADVGCLVRPLTEAGLLTDGAECGGWRVRVSGDGPEVSGSGSADDWWRAVAAACWQVLDTTGGTVPTESLAAPVA